jgi:hypothetical protein
MDSIVGFFTHFGELIDKSYGIIAGLIAGLLALPKLIEVYKRIASRIRVRGRISGKSLFYVIPFGWSCHESGPFSTKDCSIPRAVTLAGRGAKGGGAMIRISINPFERSLPVSFNNVVGDLKITPYGDGAHITADRAEIIRMEAEGIVQMVAFKVLVGMDQGLVAVKGVWACADDATFKDIFREVTDSVDML